MKQSMALAADLVMYVTSGIESVLWLTPGAGGHRPDSTALRLLLPNAR